jgi:DNA-directed RNA polymerase subunit F
LQEIKEFVAAESKGSTQLNDALQKALEAQSTFQKLEQEARGKLQEELERVSVLQSSNSTLNKSLCEAHETVRFVENLNPLCYHLTGLKSSKMC